MWAPEWLRWSCRFEATHERVPAVNMVLWWGVAAACGYLLGSINPAVLIARVFGKDLRQVGSGNPGATNVGRALGPRWAVLVGFLDVLKGLVPALVFGLLVGEIAGEIAGFAAVLGHITSPFLKGRGGKGVSTTLGAILGVQPWFAIPVLIAFGIGVWMFHRVGIGAAIAAVVLAITGVVYWQVGWADGSDAAFAVALAALVLGRHWRNLRQAIWR